MYALLISGLIILLLLIIQMLSGKGIVKFPITCHIKTLAILIVITVVAHITIALLYFFGG